MAHSVSLATDAQETTSEKVISAVAEQTDTDPLSLEPLYTAVDPDALNALFECDHRGFDRAPDRVEFTYCGCDVVVSAEKGVEVSTGSPEAETERTWL